MVGAVDDGLCMVCLVVLFAVVCVVVSWMCGCGLYHVLWLWIVRDAFRWLVLWGVWCDGGLVLLAVVGLVLVLPGLVCV